MPTSEATIAQFCALHDDDEWLCADQALLQCEELEFRRHFAAETMPQGGALESEPSSCTIRSHEVSHLAQLEPCSEA